MIKNHRIGLNSFRLYPVVGITMNNKHSKFKKVSMPTVLSLFDYSGNWSRPYKEAGYKVIQIDKKLGTDIMTWDFAQIHEADIILIAFPCTDYALSGAKHFARKDADGTTEKSQALLRQVKEILYFFRPKIWCLENPMSRIHKLNPWLGEVKFKFNPYDFGDGCQKQTWLWGRFNDPIKSPGINQGNWMFKNLGGKSERTKELRSNTDLGFAYAFYQSNQLHLSSYPNRATQGRG